MNKFTKDQKVRSVYGEVLTVMFQRGIMVMTYEKGFYPASKVFAAHENNETRNNPSKSTFKTVQERFVPLFWQTCAEKERPTLKNVSIKPANSPDHSKPDRGG